MIVHVTKDHINCGDRKNPQLCPIALAMADSGFKNINVGPNTMDAVEDLIGSVKEHHFEFSDAIGEWIIGFDHHGSVEEIDIKLDIDHGCADMVAKDAANI